MSDLSFLEAPFEVLFMVIKRCCQMELVITNSLVSVL